jgi:general L-amino acid transport system permease protein
VNSFIALFKDTSLVYIVGMKDLLEAVKTKNDTALEWQSSQTATTGYAFAALVFWAFCFSMSRYSQYMERRLHTGHRR